MIAESSSIARRYSGRGASVNRRAFIQQLGLGAFVSKALDGDLLSRAITGPSSAAMKADVLIIGGGTGGCTAALAAARNGLHVILTEETDWIGGQLTAQGVPPEEHPWIEGFGATRAYGEFRARVREYRKPLACFKEYRNNPHHQRMLSPASSGVEHRRISRRPPGVLPGAQSQTAASAERQEAA
jgi:glycine/D-amino acid oxidase-like deaminating enzyme